MAPPTAVLQGVVVRPVVHEATEKKLWHA